MYNQYRIFGNSGDLSPVNQLENENRKRRLRDIIDSETLVTAYYNVTK